MRSLTASLLAAQKQGSATPYLKVGVKNRMAGAIRYDWNRLYTGAEDDYFHALTMPGDGSLVRARITPPADSRKLYRQRVAAPGEGSDFSQWTDTGQYNAVAVAVAACGAEVSICWVNTSRAIKRIKSTDYGVSWGSPETIDYSPTTSVNGLAAAYKANGDLALFFADQSTLYVKKCLSGQWQTKSAWDKSTGDLSGVACIYNGDWNLLVTGQGSSGNHYLWSLVYGDGADVSAGTWSALKVIAAAPAGGDFTYRQPFLSGPDVFRAFFVEDFSGTESYQRPFWTHTVAGAAYLDSLWREPVPFDFSTGYGLALAYDGDYGWLAHPAGVWRAARTEQSLDLTGDVIGARLDLREDSGKLTVELRNDEAQYAAPGEGGLAALDLGCQVDFSPGFRTTEGNEASAGQSFTLEAYEHTSAGGKAGLRLYAGSGWEALGRWHARHQFRWNKSSPEANVREILAFVLARVGLSLSVVSESPVMTDFYPDFTINPGNNGAAVVRKLLSFVPDVIFIEGNSAYVVHAQSGDSAVYSYGVAHPVTRGEYLRQARERNRVQVEGYAAGILLAENFAWEEIARVGDRWAQIEDGNLGTADEASARGDAFLRGFALGAEGGAILVPVNCGQQLYDVVAITDVRAGRDADLSRVLGLTLVYRPHLAEYEQRCWLGAV
ncbi:MAG: hypothetical protein ABID87_02110 [Chloroflexota bacterium]